jgi:Ras-related protein Rab-5C
MRTLKVVFVGETRVGKSSLLRRFVEGTFDDAELNTIGTAFSTKVIPTSSGTILLQLWDTAGQEQYRALASMYYRNAHVALLTYDITRRETFTKLSAWAAEVSENAPGSIRSVVVANKSDLGARAVARDEGRAFADAIGAVAYIETSAKIGEGVRELFQAVGAVDPAAPDTGMFVAPGQPPARECIC